MLGSPPSALLRENIRKCLKSGPAFCARFSYDLLASISAEFPRLALHPNPFSLDPVDETSFCVMTVSARGIYSMHMAACACIKINCPLLRMLHVSTLKLSHFSFFCCSPHAVPQMANLQVKSRTTFQMRCQAFSALCAGPWNELPSYPARWHPPARTLRVFIQQREHVHPATRARALVAVHGRRGA